MFDSDEANIAKMNFFQGSPSAFQGPNEMFPYISGSNDCRTPLIANQCVGTSFSQQWQSPLGNSLPSSWATCVPNVMPWSHGIPSSSTQSSIFPFSQSPPNAFCYSPAPAPILPSISPSNNYYPISNQPTPNQFKEIVGAQVASASPASTFPFCNNFNQNNKRQIPTVDEDIEIDFETSRPTKKYITDDKVLEIFDRLHIREGDHYIVEDAPEEAPIPSSNCKHNVAIEVLEDDEDLVLELSPELKNAFQCRNTSITDKLLEGEKDKLSKAVVLWQPNALLKTLIGDAVHDANSETEDEDRPQIEEVYSDQDEEMDNWESDMLIEPIKDEQEEDIIFDSME